MSNNINSEDKQISNSRWLESAVKIEIINNDETIIDTLTSVTNFGSIKTDSSSYVRRTYDFTMSIIDKTWIYVNTLDTKS